LVPSPLLQHVVLFSLFRNDLCSHERPIGGRKSEGKKEDLESSGITGGRIGLFKKWKKKENDENEQKKDTDMPR
jgi:hypothetical protein